jgi:hypothetical protein
MSEETAASALMRARRASVPYSEEVADAILYLLGEGRTLTSICKCEGMPDRSTVLRWVDSNKAFAERYETARKFGWLCQADEIMDIADDGTNDWTEKVEDGVVTYVVNHDHIARSRLRVDTRKWNLGKVLPRIYGDKAALELSGPNGTPLAAPEVPVNELARRVAFLLMQAQASGRRSPVTLEGQASDSKLATSI